MFGEQFKTWLDIHEWCKQHGFKRVARRLEINNMLWQSSGEFGRSQVAICDAIRACEHEETALVVAEDIDKSLATDFMLAVNWELVC